MYVMNSFGTEDGYHHAYYVLYVLATMYLYVYVSTWVCGLLDLE